jgi:hypothetical protein
VGKRIIGIGLFLIILGVVGEGPLLTWLVEKNITRALTKQAQVVEEMDLELAPLKLKDLRKGQMGPFTFSADRLGFAQGPVFTNIDLQSKGMNFNPDALFQEGQLQIRAMQETVMTLQLSEAELTAMMRRDLPEFEPTVFLEDSRVELEGFLALFGQSRLPFSASATLEKASERSLRLALLGLKVAGVAPWADLFNKYAQEMSWEFPLEIPWPLRLESFQVRPGVIQMEWREEALE